MQPEWLTSPTSPGRWIIACVFAGNAPIPELLFIVSPTRRDAMVKKAIEEYPTKR